MINFNTNNLVIFYYPAFTGGRFLINCLGLSDSAVFQDESLVERQLNNNFNINDKIQYLRNALANTKDNWNDLGMECNQLFGIANENYVLYPSSLIKQNRFPLSIEKLTNSNLKFFLATHKLPYLEKYLDVWPNAKIIMFENCHDFLNWRINETSFQTKWEQLRGQDWPEKVPSSIKELETLSDTIVSELHSRFFQFYGAIKWQCVIAEWESKEILKYKNNVQTIVWNNNLYFSCDATVDKIEQLYDELDLTNFNKDYIVEYYNLWMNKLRELKQQ